MLNTAKKVILKNRDGEWLTPYTADTLKKNQITNCITEIPQKIKIELNNGIATIKAGSILIVPNGFEEDGVTKKFDEVTIQEDVPFEWKLNRKGDFVAYNPTTKALAINTATYSGTTEQTGCIFYNTQTNLVHDIYTDFNVSGYSFPILRMSSDSNGIVSIDQVFNGFGYIGSTFWMDKGVKMLMPDGRNEDGSLKNIEYETSKVSVYTRTWNVTDQALFIHTNKNIAPEYTFWLADAYYETSYNPMDKDNYWYWHNPETNKDIQYVLDQGYLEAKGVFLGWVRGMAGSNNITYFEIPQVLDVSKNNKGTYIVDKYTIGTSWYRVWSDGWCEQGGLPDLRTNAGTQNIALLKSFADGNYGVQLTLNPANGSTFYQNQVITKNTSSFTLYTANNSTGAKICWYAYGYLS